MLENNLAGLTRAEIERVVGDKHNRLLRQQQYPKALPTSKGTTPVDRGKRKNRRPHKEFEGNCFNCEGNRPCAGECRSSKKSKNTEMPPPLRRVEVRASTTSAEGRSILLTSAVACARVLGTGLANVRSEELITKPVLGRGEESLVFNFCPPQGIIFSKVRKTDSESGGGARSEYSGGRVSENKRRRYAGGGSESAQHNRGTLHARTCERGHNAETTEAMGKDIDSSSTWVG